MVERELRERGPNSWSEAAIDAFKIEQHHCNKIAAQFFHKKR